ncbi:MAG: hypothetical protein JW744_04990 [Candidatus Diapherotrites archaeon]|uniref:Uncharacterized protein n=1 Tax=Candidatus Iainarchaeum sp. TaxID=3101447 RepID=A0A938YYQ9_9ARCH|nr:hypothetical protein [Candidatus Diapherotrites archaeon]
MGFILKSSKLAVCLFIFYIVMDMLRASGIQIFGNSYYTEMGFALFMIAIFMDITFSFHKW